VWTTGGERGIEQMWRSSQLLRSEVVDALQIHNLIDWRAHLASLRQMKEEGQICELWECSSSWVKANARRICPLGWLTPLAFEPRTLLFKSRMARAPGGAPRFARPQTSLGCQPKTARSAG
jgi:hypothetical protein